MRHVQEDYARLRTYIDAAPLVQLAGSARSRPKAYIEALCLVTDLPIVDTRECRCGVPAIGHITDEDGSRTRFDDDDEVSINHAGLTAHFTVVLRSLQTMEGLGGTRPELNKQYHKEKTSKTYRRIITTRTSRPKAVQVSTQEETIDYEPDDYRVKDAQIVALPTEEREREKRRVRIAKEKKASFYA